MSEPSEHWKNEPEEHDYPAAAAYLEVLLPRPDANRLVAALGKAQESAKLCGAKCGRAD